MNRRLFAFAATFVLLLAFAPAAYAEEASPEESASETLELTFDPTRVKENSDVGTVVGSLGLTNADRDTDYVYSLVGGEGSRHNSLFRITDGAVVTDAILDFEALGKKLKIRIAASVGDDKETLVEQPFVVTLKDVDDVTVTPARVAENVKAGTVVGALTAPNAPGGVTYSLTTGGGHRHNHLFDIVDGSLVTAGSLDYEQRGGSLSVRVAATSGGAVLYENTVTVSLTDVADIAVHPSSLEENVEVGTVVGALSVAGDESGASYRFALANGPGDASNDAFVIVAGELTTAAEMDFETMGASLSIRVKAIHKGTGEVVYRNAITIRLIDLDDEDPEVSAAEQEIFDALSPSCDPYSGEFVILRFPQLDPDSKWSYSFGNDRDGGVRKHRGADIFGEKHTPVVAVAEGTVVRYGTGPRAGHYVVIRHEGGWETIYIHLNNDTEGTDDGAVPLTEALAPGIAPGAEVAAGQLLGWVGDSGNAETTPSHTHFELWDNGHLADPHECLDQAWEWQNRVWELGNTIS